MAEPRTIVQSSYVRLLGLLTTPPARPPSVPYLETLCHLLGEITDPMCWVQARAFVYALFRDGSLSEDFLLTHAYPGLLRAFVVQVARCGYATSSPPGQIASDSETEKLLFQMLVFVAAAFSTDDVSQKQGTPPEPELLTDGPSLKPQTLPRLAELLVLTRAAESAAALSESPYYVYSNLICSAAAQAVSKDPRTYRAILDQMVPALALKIYEDCDGPCGRCVERGILLRHITRVLRPDNKCLGFTVLPATPDFSGERRAMYMYDTNFAAVSRDIIIGKQHVVAKVFEGIEEGSLEARVALIVEDMKEKQ